MGLFSFLDFGGNAIKDALRRNAVIIDVRPPYQYDQGKVRGSLNIPIEQIRASADYIKGMKRPVLICGSSADTADAVRILKRYGVSEVFDAGSWERVLKLLKSI